MPSHHTPGRSRARRTAGATALGLALAATPAVLVTAPAQAAPVPLTLLDFNDFHGRINSSTTKFATAIEQVRAAQGDANTLLLSAGDNIGASLFASAYADDAPTVDVLNALDVTASAVGNHEFDKGFDWLRSHVVEGTGTRPDGSPYPAAEFPYLGANVVDAGTGEPALPASTVTRSAGVNVCIVGAVTQETPSLVSPAGIEGLQFTDPVTAVNEEVARLAAAGTDCDLTVASYHEGAPGSEPLTQAEQEADSAVFRHLTQDTAAAVDVIYNGHTHQKYAYSGTRPVVQAGQYGENLSRVDLTVDPATNTVSGATASQVAPAAEDLSHPRVAEVKRIVDTAIAESNVIGDQPVGRIGADVTRADADPAAPGVQDNRAAESTVGNMVADALWSTPIEGQPTPDLGLTNPGGLRADLLYAGDLATSPHNTDGVVTFEEANAVLPFVNNVSYVTLTGASLKRIFEQQWQPASASRPYLHLGVSDNVEVDLDASRPEGQRVTRIQVGGQDVDPEQEYVVSTFSFLAAGGDNFFAFTEGDAVDTGRIDRDLWIDGFFGDGEVKSPDYTERQNHHTVPQRLVEKQQVSATWSRVDITSLGTPQNSQVAATLTKPDGTVKRLGTFAVTDHAAALGFRMPSGVPDGSFVTLRTDATGADLVIPAGKAPGRR